MKYERVKMGAGAFSDIMPPGSALYQSPKLPTFEITVDKWICEIPDFRCLNEMAVDVFEGCLNQALEERGAEEARFQIPDGFPEDRINLIIDILMAMKIEGKKRGDGNFNIEFLARGARVEGNVLVIEMVADNARAIYDFCSGKTQKEVDYFRVAAAIIRRFLSEDRVKMLEVLKQEAQT